MPTRKLCKVPCPLCAQPTRKYSDGSINMSHLCPHGNPCDTPPWPDHEPTCPQCRRAYLAREDPDHADP